VQLSVGASVEIQINHIVPWRGEYKAMLATTNKIILGGSYLDTDFRAYLFFHKFDYGTTLNDISELRLSYSGTGAGYSSGSDPQV
jgi:hypothetical protein